MILWFSGTGNTRFLAEYIADATGDEAKSINDILKHGRKCEFESDKPYVIAAPIYAWRYPAIVEKFLRKAYFGGNRRIYFLATMGSQTGNADRILKKLSAAIDMDYMGFCGVPMPNNYVPMKMQPQNEAEDIIREALPLMKELAEKIRSGRNIDKFDRTPAALLMSGAVNKAFARFAGGSRDFTVNDCCISCGDCADFCPSSNIIIVEGKPVFREKCLSCFGCINRCPVSAIVLKNGKDAMERYVSPLYSDWKKKGLI
jgi:ferredoxin